MAQRDKALVESSAALKLLPKENSEVRLPGCETFSHVETSPAAGTLSASIMARTGTRNAEIMTNAK